MSVESGPSLTVIFEATYQTFYQYGITNSISALKMDPGRLACIVHSVPTTLTGNEVSAFVKQLQGLASSLFVTEQDTDLYTSFGELWLDFTQDMTA